MRTKAPLTLAVTLVALAAAAAGAQRRAPRLGTSADMSTAPDDRDLLDRVGRWPDFDAYVGSHTVTFPVTRGGDLLELFRVADATQDLTLRHVSPVVRLYSASHLLRERPAFAGRLASLLADDAPVARAAFGDRVEATSVRNVIVELLCAHSGELSAMSVLRAAAKDPRLLAVWSRARACLSAPREVAYSDSPEGLAAEALNAGR